MLTRVHRWRVIAVGLCVCVLPLDLRNCKAWIKFGHLQEHAWMNCKNMEGFSKNCFVTENWSKSP